LQQPTRRRANGSASQPLKVAERKGGVDQALKGLAASLAFAGVLASGIGAFAQLAPERPATAMLKAEETPAKDIQRGKPKPVLLVDLNADGAYNIASPSTGHVRGHDAYGSGSFGALRDGGARTHAGVDYVATAGESIRAPIGGEITKIGFAYPGDKTLRFIEIRHPESGVTARVFYVDPEVAVGATVVAGEGIGLAQDLTKKYPGGMTNHVHVDICDHRGAHLDPTDILPTEGVMTADKGAVAGDLLGAGMP
jgi:peptidoglycan LD-endopeptidase LytH